MDIQTRDRASQDVAPVPDRQPGVPVRGAGRVKAAVAAGPLSGLAAPGRGRRLLLLLLAAALLALAWHANAKPRHEAFSAVPDALRALAATVVVFGIGGFGVVRLLVPGRPRGYAP